LIKNFGLGLFFLAVLIQSVDVRAEYRAYQYLVKTNDPYAVATNAKAQYIVSTLNPQIYKSYHGSSFITVDLLRTWICPGYTGRGQKICDHPYDTEDGDL
jgi:hypothetical protein